MSDRFIVSHDLGTSSDKAVLVTVDGQIVGIAQKNYALNHPQPGYAEQNPLDWWDAVCETTKQVVDESQVNPAQIVGITFSSLMQCLIPVAQDGSPLYPAITWLDGRSASTIREKLWRQPRIKGYNPFKLMKFLRITGGTPGHTGKEQIGKILWLQEHEPDIAAKVFKYIDAKDFIILKLCNKYITSVDVAVIWWLLDWRKKRYHWSAELCKLANIKVNQLSEVHESAEVIGTITTEAAIATGLVPGTPVINGAGDLGAAAIGSGAITDGEMHINIGTSGWVAGHFIKPKKDIIHYAGCIGSAYPKKYYLGMAHQETAGICLEWLSNLLFTDKAQICSEYGVRTIFEALDKFAEKSSAGANGLLFTPWMFGERCPIDADYVRGSFFNLNLQHNRNDIVRAVYEGVAFNTRWALETLEQLYKPVSSLNMIGGGANSDIWCQIMANIMNRKIHQMEHAQQSGALGVALLASLTLGYIKDFAEIKKYRTIRTTFTPDAHVREKYDHLFTAFKSIFQNNKKWFSRMNRE